MSVEVDLQEIDAVCEINDVYFSIILAKVGLVDNFSSTDAPAKIGLIDSASALAKVGLVDHYTEKPISPMCVPMSNGVALVCWTKPNDYVFVYEIYISFEYNGIYELIETTQYERVILTELPVGTVFYLKIIAVYANGSKSDPAQIKLGKFLKSTYQFNFISIEGTVIKAGYLINFKDPITGFSIPMTPLFDITF